MLIGAEPSQLLCKIISGGQTGADQAGLQAGRTLGYETGGTAPPDFHTSSGPQPELLGAFGLVAMDPVSSMVVAYCMRSKKNVDDADATLVFRVQKSPGTDNTIGYCITGQWKRVDIPDLDTYAPDCSHRPVLVVRELTQASTGVVRDFLDQHGVRILNVAGHRPWRERPNWSREVELFLLTAIPAVGLGEGFM